MNILLVTQDYFPARGGIQSYCHQLAVNLVALGHQLTIICPGEKHIDDVSAPFKIERLGGHSSFLFLKLFGFLKARVQQEAKEIPFDHILLAQWQNAIPLLFPLQAFKGPKIHTMVHGRELLHGVFGPFTGMVARQVFKKINSAVPNSNPVAGLFRQTVPSFSNIQVIHPGVDPKRFVPVDTSALKKKLGIENKLILTSITRLVARKNINLVVEAMPEVLAKIPNAHFVIGGTGPEFEAIKARVLELKLSESISVIGNVPEEELVAYFSLGDVFLLPSSESKKDVEGFGIVFLEAGACEVAVIGAKTGGIIDAVVDGKTGVLIEKIDRSTLAAAIIQLLQDPEKARQMGKNSRERILQSLSWEQCAQEYIQRVFVS